jgi:hypothetical protein
MLMEDFDGRVLHFDTEAATAYAEIVAARRRTCDRFPLMWVVIQTNLGNALATLGARESGTAGLEEAVTAYRVALEVAMRVGHHELLLELQEGLANAERLLDERRI